MQPNLTDAEQNYYNNLPAWVTAAFAIAAFAGAFACIAFLFKKKWATLLFQISLLGVLAQFIYNFFIQKYVELTGDKMIMPFIVILISIFLVWYSKKSESNGYLS